MHQNQNLSFYYASFEVLVSSIFPFDEQSHISYGTVYQGCIYTLEQYILQHTFTSEFWKHFFQNFPNITQHNRYFQAINTGILVSPGECCFCLNTTQTVPKFTCNWHTCHCSFLCAGTLMLYKCLYAKCYNVSKRVKSKEDDRKYETGCKCSPNHEVSSQQRN